MMLLKVERRGTLVPARYGLPRKEATYYVVYMVFWIGSAYFCLDGRVGIPNSPEHRRPTWLAQVYLHAELSQFNRPRRGA